MAGILAQIDTAVVLIRLPKKEVPLKNGKKNPELLPTRGVLLEAFV